MIVPIPLDFEVAVFLTFLYDYELFACQRKVSVC